MPSTNAIEKPISIRCSVVWIESNRTPLSTYRRNAVTTCFGSGNRNGDQMCRSYSTCHSAISAA